MTEPQKYLQGQVVNEQYTLGEYLGGSDHSAVFRTEVSGRKAVSAAIKLVLARPGSTEQQLSRWRIAAKLAHPNLLRIFDAGRCELEKTEMLYVVMELAEEDLSQILPERALTPAEARQMLGPLLDALAALHEKGFVHGHIKPSNVLAIGEDLKLSSDGICRIDEARNSARKPDAYDAPETAGGGMSAATDVWSLGVTVAEALTQRPPAWPEAGQKDATLAENFPPAFVDMVRHCLRREASRRWKIAEIQEWLKRPQRAKEIAEPAAVAAAPAPESSAPVAGGEAARRSWVLPAVAAGVIVVAAIAWPRILGHRNKAAEASGPVAEARNDSPKGEGESKAAPRAEAQPKKDVKKRTDTAPSAKPPTATPPAAAKPSVVETRATPKPAASPATPGGVVQQVVPEVSERARSTIQGTVRVGVRVKVDPSGKVIDSALNSTVPSRYFADLSVKAANGWKFSPPVINGQSAASEWVLHFGYRQDGTNVIPERVSP